MGLFSVFLLLSKALGQTDFLGLASMHLLYPDCNASPLPRPALLVQWLLNLPSVDHARSGYGMISRLVRILPCPSLSGCAEPGLGPAPLCTQRSSAVGCLSSSSSDALMAAGIGSCEEFEEVGYADALDAAQSV